MGSWQAPFIFPFPAHPPLSMKPLAILLLCLLPLHVALAEEVGGLYKRTGEDPSFAELLREGRIEVGRNTTDGVKGSCIRVDRSIQRRGGDIPQDIALHTLCHSFIPRANFERWTRWYQEDGNTQIFRLFKGEKNVRNERAGAARVETFSRLQWSTGKWHEWEGRFTIVHPHGCSIFQVKNSIHAWSVMINLSDKGDISLNHRRHQKDKILARGMTGKSFDLRVRDNGHDYEVFFNGERVGGGQYDRPTGKTAFRWGMYLGSSAVRHDAMLFVSQVKFR